MSIVFAQIMAVISSYQRQPKILFQTEQIGVDPVLHLQPLILYFEIKVSPAKHVPESSRRFARCRVLPFHQTFSHFAFQAA